MVIAFSAGGTLGHIMPALSFIEKLKSIDLNIKIIFFATIKDQQYEILNNNKNIDQIYYLEAYGKPTKWQGYFKVIFQDLKILFLIKKILKKAKVDVLVGMGGYISGLCIYAGNHLNIKTIIHEQNSVIGLANKINLKKTDLILTTFKHTLGLEKHTSKTILVGHPRFMDAKKMSKNIFVNKQSILVTSGTLGSYQINQVIKEFIHSPLSKKYTITIITGKKYYEELKNTLPVDYHYIIKAFSNNILEELSKAGIVISRAGATTLFEILGSRTPAIVIPSPNVVNQHQYYNAKSLSELGLVQLLEEKDLNYITLNEALEEIIHNYDSYIYRLNHFGIGPVTDNFYQAILQVMKKEKKNG